MKPRQDNEVTATTLELHPSTGTILNHAIRAFQVHQPGLEDDQARQIVLDAIREEEIKMHKLLVHFCRLPVDERKTTWTRIFARAVESFHDKKVRKKMLKAFLHDLETCLMECDPPVPPKAARSFS